MSRSRFPPTPSMSGDFIVRDHPPIESTDVFALPPAAVDTVTSRRASYNNNNKSDHIFASPVSPDFMALVGSRSANNNNPRQLASGTKRPLEDFSDLPPPPTRTRKIIQMRPKTQQSPPAKASAGKATKDAGKGGASASTSSSAAGNNSANGAAPPNGKKKLPSATSAAGRKNARKTAHSLIERRRRSKMNEEFTTLKDMIPACNGQEMHKLAILQASIDYVNYLEQCIKDLKTAGDRQSTIPTRPPPAAPPSPTSPQFLAELGGPGEDESEQEASVSPEIFPEQAKTSPSYSPRTRVPSVGTVYEFTQSILPSPALGPSHPSHSAEQYAYASWPASAAASANTSPALQPQQRNADVDHEASAALLMLNQDRRGTMDSIVDRVNGTCLEGGKQGRQETGRRTGMSVRDLLTS